MKTSKFALIALFLLLAAHSVSAQPKKPTIPKVKVPGPRYSLLWQITKPGSADTSYLFGTMHLLEKSYIDTMPGLMRALNRADAIVGELVVDSVAKPQLLGSAIMKGSLRALLKEKDYALASSEAERLTGLPLAFFDHFKPIMIYTTLLEGLYTSEHPENHKSGVPMDLFFQNEAKRTGRPVLGLETGEDQADLLFDSIPIKKQVRELVDFIRHEDKTIADMNKMLKSYASGQIEGIIDDQAAGGFTAKEMKSMLYDRNAKWLKLLPDILAKHQAFIAVGAGHLPGKFGLVEGLRKLGFQVTAASLN